MPIPISPTDQSGLFPVENTFVGEVDESLGRLVALNEPISDRLSNELGNADLSLVNGGEFRLGSPETLSIGFGAQNSLQAKLFLKRATDEQLDGFDEYLPEGVDFTTHFILACYLQTSSAIESKAGVPIGSYFAVRGKAEVSGALEYRYCRVLPRDTGSRVLLMDFLSNLRWPLCNARQAVDRYPDDIAITRFRGELNLWGELELAYAVSGSRSLDLEGVEPSVRYDVGAGVRLGGSCGLGGTFSVVSSTGGKADWIRLRIERSASASSESHLGLDVRIGLETEKFASRPERLLTALTGFNPQTVLEWLAKVASATDLKQGLLLVKKESGERASRLVEKLAGTLFRSQTFDSLVNKIRTVLNQYEQFKTQGDARLLDLIAEHVRTGDVASHLRTILEVTTREGLSNLSDGRVWAAIDKLVGDRAYDLFSDESLFLALRSRAETLLGLIEGTGQSKAMLNLIEELETRYNVDQLLNKIEAGIDKETLLALASGEAADLLDLLFDVTAAELTSKKADAVLGRVSMVARRVGEFRDKTARSLAEGLKKNLEISLLQTRSKTEGSSTLMDVEFNLGSERGRALYNKARNGDFLDVLKNKEPANTLVHKGTFQESLARSASLKVHCFGWDAQFDVGIEHVSKMEHVQQEAGGPLFLLNSEFSQSMRNLSGFSQQESVQSVLQFGIQARSHGGQLTSSPILVDLVDSVNCSFQVLHRLSNPPWKDLHNAFQFAAQLGLLDDPWALVSDLEQEFGPAGPKKASVTYRIGYNPEAYASLWSLELDEDGEDRALVSKTFREALMDRWAYDKPGFISRQSCDHYLKHSRIRRRRSRRKHRTTTRYYVTDENGEEQAVAWVTDTLWKAYQAERDMLHFLGELDRALEAHQYRPDWKRLNRALENFLGVPRLHPTARLWKGHLFFLVADALLLAESGNARAGKTVLQLDLTPAEGDSVRRFYPDFLLG